MISISHPYLLAQGTRESQVSLLIQDHLYLLLGQFVRSHLLVHFLLCFQVELVPQAAPVVLDSLFRAHSSCYLFILPQYLGTDETNRSNCIPLGFMSSI